MNGSVTIVPTLTPGVVYGSHVVIGTGFPGGNGVIYPATFAPYVINLGTTGPNINVSSIPDLQVGSSPNITRRFSTNVNGIIAITDPNAEATVTFAIPEPDNAYRIQLTLLTQSHPELVNTLYYRAPTQFDFVVGMTAPMGGGYTCWVQWELTR